MPDKLAAPVASVAQKVFDRESGEEVYRRELETGDPRISSDMVVDRSWDYRPSASRRKNSRSRQLHWSVTGGCHEDAGHQGV